HVLDSCLQLWNRRFIQNRHEWRTRVLFRSLEIACQASRVPAVGTRTPTIHDLGVGIALWISAFEILTHPKKGSVFSPTKAGASKWTVLDLLEKAPWLHPQLRAKPFRVIKNSKRKGINLVQNLYRELYRARNDFLHGNPVTADNLFPKKEAGMPTLLQCA